MINITDKEQCCGCNACGDICPHKAISFKSDNEGFLYPDIDNSKCVDCGLCEIVCPMLSKVNNIGRYDKPKVFAAYAKDELLRLDSTSGGIHSTLALLMYYRDAFVSGAIYNKDYSVSHIVSDNKDDLPKIRSSKYVQSDTRGIYKQIKKLLDSEKNVFFCGTPCQVQALYKFIRKDYDGLITCDFVCRGVNSPRVFLSYINMLERQHKSKVKGIKFKAKKWGWHNFSMKVSFENGLEYCKDRYHDPFFVGYLQYGNFARPSCYNCPFKDIPQRSDITLGDFWGIEKKLPELDQDKGTSLVMVNSKKGLAFFESIKDSVEWKETQLEIAIEGNPAIVSPLLSTNSIDRNQFFMDIEKLKFEEVYDKYFVKKEVSKNFKEKIYSYYMFLRNMKALFKEYKLSFYDWYTFYNINYLNRKIEKSWPFPFFNFKRSIVEIREGAILTLNANFKMGTKQVKGSMMETRLLMEKDSRMIIDGDFEAFSGSYIRVIENGVLILHGGFINENVQITCGDRIEIGKGCAIARDVVIRSYDGHVLSTKSHSISKPIFIGEHVWIGQRATILKGVSIGDGAIIAAGALVTSNIPAKCLAGGVPAKVLRTNITWH